MVVELVGKFKIKNLFIVEIYGLILTYFILYTCLHPIPRKNDMAIDPIFCKNHMDSAKTMRCEMLQYKEDNDHVVKITRDTADNANNNYYYLMCFCSTESHQSEINNN